MVVFDVPKVAVLVGTAVGTQLEAVVQTLLPGEADHIALWACAAVPHAHNANVNIAAFAQRKCLPRMTLRLTSPTAGRGTLLCRPRAVVASAAANNHEVQRGVTSEKQKDCEEGQMTKKKIKPRWEPVHRSTARDNNDAGDYRISVYRLPVTGGWLYNLTEWTDDHRHVTACFVPAVFWRDAGGRS